MPRASARAVEATQHVLINTGRSGVVYDTEGHSIGGGERVTVTEVDAIGQAAVDRGRLVMRTVDSGEVPE